MKHLLVLKILLRLLAVLGLLIVLGQMLGVFRDSDKLEFVKILENKLECPKNHPGAKKFINDFVYTNPDYRNIDINEAEIEKIIFVGFWVGQSNNRNERRVESVNSGTVKLKAFRGHVTKPLCSFEDLKTWSKESPFWKWLGWGIAAIGVFLEIALFVIEEIYTKKTQSSL